MTQKKVLITGMNGLIGGVVRERLEGKYALSTLNRRSVPGRFPQSCERSMSYTSQRVAVECVTPSASVM